MGEVAGLLGVHGRFIGERGSGVDREYGGVIGECHVSREMGDHERIVLVNVLYENFVDLKTKERSIQNLDSRLY